MQLRLQPQDAPSTEAELQGLSGGEEEEDEDKDEDKNSSSPEAIELELSESGENFSYSGSEPCWSSSGESGLIGRKERLGPGGH